MHRSCLRVVALGSVLLAGCSSAPATIDDATGPDRSASPSAPDSTPILVSVWLLDGWPKQDPFDFRIDAPAEGGGELEPVTSTFRSTGLPPNTYLLTTEGMTALERDIAEGSSVQVVTAPRLLVLPGQPAEITIGSADDPTPAFHLAIRAAPTSTGTQLSWHCESADHAEAGTGERRTLDAEPYEIPAGRASATLLGTREGGGWRLLVVRAEGVERR